MVVSGTGRCALCKDLISSPQRTAQPSRPGVLALTIAMIPTLTAFGRVGQTVTTLVKSGSEWANDDEIAALFAALGGEMPEFPLFSAGVRFPLGMSSGPARTGWPALF